MYLKKVSFIIKLFLTLCTNYFSDLQWQSGKYSAVWMFHTNGRVTQEVGGTCSHISAEG